ncbi:MAG: trypsin-like peptidase domain-containing protein [Epsilonproteobacteria bacterium]|nr:trypsin-like peptidase domain-containing protein [Campylobacterota bacterium]
MKRSMAYVVVGAVFLSSVMFAETAGEERYTYEKLESETLQTRHERSISDPELSWDEVTQRTSQSVVQVFSYIRNYDVSCPWNMSDRTACRGSGFFVSNDGHIVTNFHVIRKADPIYVTIFAAGKERFEVEFIGGSSKRDFALLKLKEYELARVKKILGVDEITYLSLGDSDKVVPGQEIRIYGYPLGDEYSLKASSGIVSGLTEGPVGSFIQTTVPTNPGNSGGPAVNKQGHVIGIASAGKLLSRTERAHGANLLVPTNTFSVLFSQIKKGKIVREPFWGFKYRPMTRATSEFFGVPVDGGIYVAKVEDESIAAQAGLQDGDIICKIAELDVDRFGYVQAPWNKEKISLLDIFARLFFDTDVTVQVWRDGIYVDLSCKIVPEPYSPIDIFHPWIDKSPEFEVLGGIVFVEATYNHLMDFFDEGYFGPAIINSYGKYLSREGRAEPRICITNIFPEGEVCQVRAIHHDDLIIESVNGQAVRTIDDFRRAVLEYTNNGIVSFVTESNARFDMFVEDILQIDPILAGRYNFVLSDLFKRLVQLRGGLESRQCEVTA